MSTESKLAQLRKLYLAQCVASAEHSINYAIKKLESPIEVLAYVSLLTKEWRSPSLEEYFSISRTFTPFGLKPSLWLLHDEYGVIGFQAQGILDGLHVRFDAVAFMHNATKSLFVIEFDGHDFHERTKEQSARDKSRDRAASLLGWIPIRFTGPEIYRQPDALHAYLEDFYTSDAAQ